MPDPEWLETARKKGLVISEGKPAQLPAALSESDNAAVRIPLKMSEKEFQKLVIDFAQGIGWKIAHFRPAWSKNGKRMMTAVAGDGKGFPDLLFVRERLFVAELKVKPNKPSEEQLKWLDWFRATGTPAFVWYPEQWDEIEKYLRS